MKEILLTSIVAATLIFSGCGGSSSSSKSGGDQNHTTPTDGNHTTPTDGNTTTPTDGNTTGDFVSAVTVNGLKWTALKKDDDNESLSGYVELNEAKARCQEIGAELPTKQQIIDAAPTLKSNDDFRSDAGDNVVVWFKNSDGKTSYFFNGKDSNVSEDNPEYVNNEDAIVKSYYTCIKQAQ